MRHDRWRQGWCVGEQAEAKASLCFIHLAKQNGDTRTWKMERRHNFVELSWWFNREGRLPPFGRVDLLESKSERKSFTVHIK